MVRYLVFAGESYYPEALSDLRCALDTLEVIPEVALCPEHDWVEILDTNTGAYRAWGRYRHGQGWHYHFAKGFPDIGQPKDPQEAFGWEPA